MWIVNVFCILSVLERWVLGVSIGVLALFFLLGLRLNNTGLYLSGGALVFGALSLAPVFFTKTLVGGVFLAFAVGYLLLFVFLSVRTAKRTRKREKEERLRKARFTLPDRQNTYLCARLHTALKTETEEKTQYTGVQLGYVCRLLEMVKNAPISAVERLETEELSGVLALYEKKERLTKTELSALGEVLARVIKLSAKYEIPV